MFLAATEKAIIMIIPFFVHLQDLGCPENCFLNVLGQFIECLTARLPWSVSLLFLLISAVWSPCFASYYRPAALHINSPLHQSRSPLAIKQGVSLKTDVQNQKMLTWFRREDVSQLLDDLLELQHGVLFLLHVLSWPTPTQPSKTGLFFSVHASDLQQVTYLLPLCPSSPCLLALRGDLLQTQERRVSTVQIRSPLNPLWAEFRKDL